MGELCVRETAEQRVLETPATDIFLMELGTKPDACAIDALHVSNASAYATFGREGDPDDSSLRTTPPRLPDGDRMTPN